MVAARRLAARIRVALAAVGTVLLGVDPGLHPRPVAAATGLGILALTSLVREPDVGTRRIRTEEVLACTAGVLIVTLGGGRVNALTVIWLVAATAGVVARGGAAGPLGRILVVAVLASPLVRWGVTADAVSVLAAGCGLLLAVGRLSQETTELLRDPLTKTMSRAAFEAQFARLAAHADPHRPLGIVLIDLDEFRALNRRRGHRAGDALLILATRAISASLDEDALISRAGPDEFAVLVIGERPGPIAERLLAALSDVGIAAGAGTATSPRDGTDVRGLLAAAEVALRLSKHKGRPRVTNYSGPRHASVSADGALAALDRLCAGDGVAMALQPIFDIETGAPRAYEALARFWVSEASESPLAWFELAESNGCRRELERACVRAAAARLDELPAGVALTLNVSADMLDDEATLAAIESARGDGELIVEVTERQPVQAERQVVASTMRLRASGVAFAVDDVGAGHAGLGQLALVRPEYLKLDRSVIRGIHDEADRATFVRSLTEYVQGSGTRVIAEGVETEADMAAVRAAGIGLVQGFLLGRPASNLVVPVMV